MTAAQSIQSAQILLNQNVQKAMETSKNKTWHEMWNAENGEAWDELIFYARLLGLRCIHCGGTITAPILKFFNFDVSRVTCYRCQDNNIH